MRHLYVLKQVPQLKANSEEGAIEAMVAYTPLEYKTRRESIRNIIVYRRELIALILLSVVMRIPRVPGVIGDDAFIVLWMGRVLSEGYFENWTLSPFALFGLYPFSSYPIGIPFIIAVMLNLGFSFEITVFLVSTSAGAVGTAGAYFLGRELFGTDQRPLFFSVFYSFSSVFVNFTYFTITPRGSFLAILPWFLCYSVKFMRGRNEKCWKLTDDGLMLVPEATIKDLAIASMFLVMLFFIHALAVFTLIYAAVVVGYYILRELQYNRIIMKIIEGMTSVRLNIKTKRTYAISDQVSLRRRIMRLAPENWPVWLTYILLIGGSLILGLLFVPIDPSKTIPFLFSNDTIIGKSWNLIVDYGIRLGLLSIFLPVGILGAFHKDENSNRKLVHIILVPLVMFILPLSLYTSVLFLPVFGYYSVVGFDIVRSSIKDRWIGFLSVGFVVIFAAVYIQYATILPIWTIGFVMAITIIAFLVLLLAWRMWSRYYTIVGRHLRKWRTSVGKGPVNFLDWQGIRILFISIIIISLITTEGIILQGEYKYVTNDERQIFEYLNEQSAPGIIFVPTPVLGRRLEAYGFKAILSFNNDATLYFGWINPSNITINSHFSISNLLSSGRLYYYSGPDIERIIWNQLFSLDLTSTAERELAIELGLEYVILEKTASGFSDVFYSIYGDYFSLLLSSTPLIGNRVVDGERLSLFHIF